MLAVVGFHAVERDGRLLYFDDNHLGAGVGESARAQALSLSFGQVSGVSCGMSVSPSG